MTTWQTIFGVDNPVRGKLYQFSNARNSFRQMRDDAQNVVDQFANFAQPSFVEGHLNDAPGVMVTEVLSQADGGLQDLPRVADEAQVIFDDHYNALDDLQERADEALARARTAWDRKNELIGQQESLQSQIDGLNSEIDDAADGADTSSLDSSLSGAESSLSTVSGELESVQRTLDGIFGDDDSEYSLIVADEDDLNESTVDALHDIDLGDLEDPGFWEKLGNAIGGFLGGLLESVANLLEALVTGDLATFFWELKGLLDVALLVLGTIALFTGVGAPLFALAVANFAITAGLWATQTPNPQTGQTMGLLDVGMSALGVVMSSAGFLRNVRGVNGWRLFTREAVRVNGPGGRFIYTATGARMPGALQTLRTNLGNIVRIRTAPVSAHGAMQGLASFTKNVPYYGANGYASNAWIRTAMNADVTFNSFWQARGTLAGIQNFVPGATPPAPWHHTTGSKGLDGTRTTLTTDFSGWNSFHGPGNFGDQGTPLFGGTPPPTQRDVLEVVYQTRQAPDVTIVPAVP